jgi:small GTP-binding protein
MTIYKLKVAFIGDSHCGKSSFLNRYINDVFFPETFSTIGIELVIKFEKYKNDDYKLYLWDTAGEEKYNNFIMSYYKNANVVYVVYDLTDLQTLKNTEHWIDQLIKNKTINNQHIILIGNKYDLIDPNNTINVDIIEHINRIKNKYNIKSYFSSSKLNYNIKEIILETLSQLTIEELNECDLNNLIVLQNTPYNTKTYCCSYI